MTHSAFGRFGTFATCTVGAALLIAALPSASRAQQPAEKRLPQLKVEQLTPEQRPLADKILKVSAVGLTGPYNPMLRSPVLGDRLFELMAYLRFTSSVPVRLNEFAILIQARLWTSQVEWYSHYPLAIKAGLSESVAADLQRGIRPTNMKPDEAIVYDVCMELSTKHVLSDAMFAMAKTIFTDQQIVDLVGVSGTYVTLAMLMAAGQEGAPGGATPLAPLPAASARPR